MTRIGLVVPSSNTTAEPEFRAMAPSSVTVHGARMPLEDVTPDGLDEMADGAERAGRLLGHADVDGVAYACTTGSLLHGPGFDADLESRLEDAVEGPAVATALSVRRAFEALDVETLAVRTPYAPELDELERDYLEATGFDVVSMQGRGIVDNTDIGALTAGDAASQVIETVEDPVEADGVFVSCTNYATVGALAALEDRFGVPVVSSNVATMWDLAHRLDVEPAIEGSLGTVTPDG